MLFIFLSLILCLLGAEPKVDGENRWFMLHLFYCPKCPTSRHQSLSKTFTILTFNRLLPALHFLNLHFSTTPRIKTFRFLSFPWAFLSNLTFCEFLQNFVSWNILSFLQFRPYILLLLVYLLFLYFLLFLCEYEKDFHTYFCFTEEFLSFIHSNNTCTLGRWSYLHKCICYCARKVQSKKWNSL